MRAYIDYFIDLMRHKYWVFLECCRLGIPWLGIIHDWSKLHPAEFPHAARKYMGNKQQKQKAEKTYPHAWLHHQHNNKHHWVYWAVYMPIPDREWSAEWGCVPIPHRYRLEMLADMRGASRRFGKPTLVWYGENENRILLHPETRQWLEKQIGWEQAERGAQ